MTFLRAYFRNPAAVIGLVLFVLVLLMAASADFFFPRDPLSLAGRPLIWPFDNPRYWLGTDSSGRDIAAQIFHGARISLLIGVVATLVAIALGILIGALAGFYGGLVDDILMRITEAFQTVPSFLLLLVLVAVFGANLMAVRLGRGLVSGGAPAGLTLGGFLSRRNRDLVLGALT